MHSKLLLPAILMLGMCLPARAAGDNPIITNPYEDENEPYIVQLKTVEPQEEDMLILRGDKVVKYKIKYNLYQYQMSDDPDFLIDTQFRMPHVKDGRPWIERHPILHKTKKVIEYVLPVGGFMSLFL